MITKEQFISRIEELSLLEDGWLDGYGNALSTEGLLWFSNTIEKYVTKNNISYPYLYPTYHGDVRAEWPTENNNLDLSIDIKLIEKSALALFWVNGELETNSLDLNVEHDWELLVSMIKQL